MLGVKTTVVTKDFTCLKQMKKTDKTMKFRPFKKGGILENKARMKCLGEHFNMADCFRN